MISVCVLPNIDGMANTHQKGTQIVHDSPHEKLHTRIEIERIFSTGLGTVEKIRSISMRV